MAGRVALVTGSTSGIGRGIALAFAREGASVVVTGLEPELPAKVVAAIEESGGVAVGHAADLTDPRAASTLVDAAVDAFGGIDTLVNAAGDPESARGADGPLDATDVEYWDGLYRSTLRSGMLVSKAALPHLRRSERGGRIVFLGSVMSLRGGGWDVYAAMKGGLNGLARSMAVTCAPDRVTVNCVAVGAVVVEKTAAAWEGEARKAFWRAQGLTRVGRPDDIAACCLWLGSDEGEYVTGSVISVDGGMAAKGFSNHPSQ